MVTLVGTNSKTNSIHSYQGGGVGSKISVSGSRGCYYHREQGQVKLTYDPRIDK